MVEGEEDIERKKKEDNNAVVMAARGLQINIRERLTKI